MTIITYTLWWLILFINHRHIRGNYTLWREFSSSKIPRGRCHLFQCPVRNTVAFQCLRYGIRHRLLVMQLFFLSFFQSIYPTTKSAVHISRRPVSVIFWHKNTITFRDRHERKSFIDSKSCFVEAIFHFRPFFP
jgi:hypothetical protein